MDTSEQRRIMVLYAHPASYRSKVNQSLFNAVKGLDRVMARDLYAEYPAFDIDAWREQRLLQKHDVLVFLCPFYWHSTPALLKEWQDIVFQYGFAYGPEGLALKDKLFFCALTTGGKEDDYQPGGRCAYTLRELLSPLETSTTLCHMRYLPPFVLFNASTAVQEGRLDQHKASWVELLSGFRDGSLNPDRARHLPTLNRLLEKAE